MGVPLITAGFYFSLPFLCLKQLINVVQLAEASCKLVELDHPKPARATQ